MAEIVLVHGIAQEQKTADGLEAEWIPPLAGGVRIAGSAELADRIRDRDLDVRMAFYGNLFLRPGQQGTSDAQPPKAESEFANELALEWLQHASERYSDQRTRLRAAADLAEIRGRPMGQAQGWQDRAKDPVKRLASIQWFGIVGAAFAERFVWGALAQVSRYFSDDALRAEATADVLALIDDETRAVIGHSLGAVVAYEACARSTQAVPLLITLGAPLGIRTVVYERLRPQPPQFPSAVGTWVNIADPDDLVALEPDLREMFSRGVPDDARFKSVTVDNGSEPHRGEFYLGKQEVGRALIEAFPSCRLAE